MAETENGFLITPAELASWIIREDDRLMLLNKPPLVVCHPSKHGPWSSLVSACREYSRLARIHLVFRLDRETSGVLVLAKERMMASWLQTAVERRQVGKRYLAILEGEFSGEREVDVPIGPDLGSVVAAKRRAAPAPDAKSALTRFRALASGGGYTIVEAAPLTGRTHQIRAHAEWLGHRVVGDKIYGPSPACFLEFLEDGWTDSLARRLPLNRQALHCLRVEFRLGDETMVFEAPPTADLVAFARERMGVDLEKVVRTGSG
ncbi:MAG TPA: RluA family pseudouridine synthase [Opitutaceae bacterium]